MQVEFIRCWIGSGRSQGYVVDKLPGRGLNNSSGVHPPWSDRAASASFKRAGRSGDVPSGSGACACRRGFDF